jgi:ribosomal protein S18 acetylase RimI-like enzyme
MRVTRLGPHQASELLRARSLFDFPPLESAARAYLEDDRNVFFLACERDEPVGFLRGTALPQLSSDRLQMFIYEVSVAVGHRRQGVGRALMQAVLQFCRSHKFEEAFVFTDPTNTAAVNLYRSTGGETETPADRMYVFRLPPR